MIAQDEKVSARMARQRTRDTAPERALRSLLFASGERYRVAYPVPGQARCTIDVAFPARNVAVYVDGCFWHDCPEHGTRPKSNSEWWKAKLARNQARDSRVTQHLTDLGWRVVRVWEHEAPDEAAEKVLNVLDRIRTARDRVS